MASELLSGSHFSSVSGDERKKRKILFFHSHLRRVLSIRITYCNVGNLPTPKREGNQGRSEVESRKKASDSEGAPYCISSPHGAVIPWERRVLLQRVPWSLSLQTSVPALI